MKDSCEKKGRITDREDSHRKKYVKPEVEEHEAIKDVTAGSCGTSSCGHYWY